MSNAEAISHIAGEVLLTKFRVPPPRASRIVRARLVERLDRGAEGKLTVLSAPPGFGKTTLLSDWLAGGPRQLRTVAWVSLDAADDHPATFWQHVLGALATAVPAIEGTGALQAISGDQPAPIETVLARVLNVFGPDSPSVTLVLDDYHVIESASIQRGMAFLVEHLPPRLHVVLATRVDPDLPLARLRARRELTEIRAGELRFTGDETALFLNGAAGLALSYDDVGLLQERTEGWPGALQLVALSLEGRAEPRKFIEAFSGTDRFVVDYLMEEVLERQGDEVRQFLLRTSILQRLCTGLCDAVTGETSGRKLLDRLDRTNLFVTALDDRRQWYRYHQLFADALMAHLAEEHPEEVAVLHSRASVWFASNGDAELAIRHAIAAADFQAAAGLVELEAEKVMRQHHPEKLTRWLLDIPDDVVRSMPVLATYHAHALQGVGDMHASAARLDDAEQALRGEPNNIRVFDEASFTALPARIAVGRGYLAMAAGDPDATVLHAMTALESTPESEHHWRATAVALLGLAHWIRGELAEAEPLHEEAVAGFEQSGGDEGLAVTSSYHHAELLKARGRLRAAEERLEASLRFVARQPAGAVRGAANLHLGLAEICCERNELEAAERHLKAALEMGVYPPRTPWRLCQARAHLLQSRGEWDAAIEQLDEAERLQVRGAVPVYRPLGAWRARMWIAQGRIRDAVAWAGSRGVSFDDELSYEREYEHITLARILIARTEPEHAGHAARLLERLLVAASAGGRAGTAIEIRILLAIASLATGNRQAAEAMVSEAVIAAEPERFVRVFLDEGPRITPLLAALRQKGLAPEFCQSLLGGTALTAPTANGAGLADRLSERELDVLRLLASELSGPEIAGQLFVSLNTLRTHTKNIYAKLGVSGRRAAINRATELKLL